MKKGEAKGEVSIRAGVRGGGRGGGGYRGNMGTMGRQGVRREQTPTGMMIMEFPMIMTR